MQRTTRRGKRAWTRDELYAERPERYGAVEARTFVDADVLLHAHDGSETTKQPIARAVLEARWSDRSGAISTQVLQEFYVVATRDAGLGSVRS